MTTTCMLREFAISLSDVMKVQMYLRLNTKTPPMVVKMVKFDRGR